MKKLILVLFTFAATSAFAMFPPSTMDSDIKSMLNYAGRAVADYGVQVVGMNPGQVKVTYNYKTRQFTATDLSKNCSFVAETEISFKKLNSGHYWKVQEVTSSNTCL